MYWQEANKPPDSWFELKVNTNVYVNGLPEDVTVDEVSYQFCFFWFLIQVVQLINSCKLSVIFVNLLC